MKLMKKIFGVVLIIFIILALLLSYAVYHFFYDLNAVKPGE